MLTEELLLGMTESSVAITMSTPHEYVPGSVGVLLPLYQARLLDQDGNEVEGFDEPGELLLSSPNQAQGYLGDNEASAATFRNGWLHTGDVAVFRQSPKGDSHLCIVDRLRDMIKVKVSRSLAPSKMIATDFPATPGHASFSFQYRKLSAAAFWYCRRGGNWGEG